MFVDYITYTPTNSTPRNGLRFLVDDRDPRVKYGTGWSQDSRTELVYNTATYSQDSGSQFEFEFEGEWYLHFSSGNVVTIHQKARESLCLVPSALPTRWSRPHSFSTATLRQTSAQTNHPTPYIYKQKMYTIDNLEQGTHTLKATLGNSGPLDIDYFIVQPGTATISSSATPSPSSGSGSASAGAIAGGVVGGVAGLTLIAFGIWWFMRRRRNQTRYDDGPKPDLIGDEGMFLVGFINSWRILTDSTAPPHLQVEPFVLPMSSVSGRSNGPQTMSGGPTSYYPSSTSSASQVRPYGTQYGSSYNCSHETSMYGGAAPAALPSSSSRLHLQNVEDENAPRPQAGPLPSKQLLRMQPPSNVTAGGSSSGSQHLDSGVRFDPDADVPPTYTRDCFYPFV